MAKAEEDHKELSNFYIRKKGTTTTKFYSETVSNQIAGYQGYRLKTLNYLKQLFSLSKILS